MKTVEILGENRFETFTKTRVGCRAVIIKDDKILLSHEIISGWWLVPGGGLEEGETPEECVIREVEEETGFIVKPVYQFLILNEYYEEYCYTSHYFVCEVTGEGQMHLTEAEQKRGLTPEWLPLKDAVEMYSTHESLGDISEEKRGSYQREYTALLEYMNCLLERFLPKSIFKHVDGKPYVTDDLGKSGSKIMIFDDCVLKAENYRKENEEVVTMMKWLEGKIPAPKVICFETDSKYQYLLMSKVKGKVSCDEYFLEHPKELLDYLAKALKMLWSVDISDCPRIRDLDTELLEAKYRVENDLVDIEDAEPATFGEGGFKDPQELLAWLEANKPESEPVLSHGDFCLPNVLIDNGDISGFIDLGDCGIGDKWRDIALCYRSLKHNFDGTFGGKVYPDFDPDMLFDALGIEPDHDKLRYYFLLDELF